MNTFLRLEAWITRAALWLAIGFLLVATVLAMYQVTTRFVLGRPSTWSEVITRSAMIWSVFIGAAPTFREGGMIAVEIVQRALPPRLGLWLHQITLALSLLFFGVLFWQGIAMVQRVANQRLAALDISIGWSYAAIPVGSAFVIVALLGCMVRAAQGEWGARYDDPNEAQQ